MFDENALVEISESVTSIEQAEARAAHPAPNKVNGSQPPPDRYREVDSKVNLLFRLIRDLKALANRACEAAVRESARATKVEETAAAEVTSRSIISKPSCARKRNKSKGVMTARGHFSPRSIISRRVLTKSRAA
jgi:hypothetical protein